MFSGNKFKESKGIVADIVAWTYGSNIFLPLFIASLFINLLGLVFPLVLLQTYDRIIPHSAYETLALLISAVIICVFIEVTLRISRAATTNWADARYEHLSSCRAFRRILSTSVQQFEKSGTGVHLENLNSLAQLKDFYGSQVLTTIFDLPFILLYLAVIAYIGGLIVLVPLFVIALIYSVTIMTKERVNELVERKRQAYEQRINFVIESISRIHTVKSLGIEPLLQRRYERLKKGAAIWDHNINMQTSHVTMISTFVSQITIILVVSFGSILVVKGMMTVGGISACTLLASRILQPIGRAISIWKRFQTIKVANKRFYSIMELEPESRPGLKLLESTQGKIELRNVTFEDRNGNKILDDINLVINPGDNIGITGEGVSGKSTLLSIIMGAINPTSGQVLIDDIDINELNRNSIRQQIAYLPQKGKLFAGSIIDNISSFGGPKEEKRAAIISELLGIDEIINRLPMGYETEVGDKAVDILPKGVIQRICIARALMCDPNIILFDEADSSVDIKGHNTLKNALSKLRGRTTTVMVSYRPSILSLCDKIYKLSGGKLEE